MNLEKRLVQELRNNEHVIQIVPLDDFEKEYLELKSIVKGSAGYVSPISDSRKAAKIIKEFGVHTDKVVIKTLGGKKYLIFKGYSGQRNILKGTRYLASNPKVVRMAIGPKGIANSVKGGSVISIILSVGIEVFDYFIRDTATLSELLGTITGDLVKIGLTTIASAVAGLLVGSSVVIGSSVAAPLVIAIAVGVVTGYALNRIDEKLGATRALIQGYEEMGYKLSEMKSQLNREFSIFKKKPWLFNCIFAPCGWLEY